jgi:hypothetical protein
MNGSGFGRTSGITAALLLLVILGIWSWPGEDNDRAVPREHADSGRGVDGIESAADRMDFAAARPGPSPDDWIRRAQESVYWSIPEALRIPGGPSRVRLADSPQAWLKSLPSSQQPAAEAFLRRNERAYAFSSKAEQVWLIENGFPSLEEVAYFAGLPRESTCMRSVDELRIDEQAARAPRACGHPKLSALSVDGHMRELEAIALHLVGGLAALEIGGQARFPRAADDFALLMTSQTSLISEGVGPYRFYQSAELERLRGEIGYSREEREARVSALLALAWVCGGDARVSHAMAPELWSHPATSGVLFAINELGTDLRDGRGRPRCLYGRTAYPPPARK